MVRSPVSLAYRSAADVLYVIVYQVGMLGVEALASGIDKLLDEEALASGIDKLLGPRAA
jgi:hypothetical protein